ncbi:MAG: hypothetical protein WCR72_18000 [Bacteroidota bacterium]
MNYGKSIIILEKEAFIFWDTNACVTYASKFVDFDVFPEELRKSIRSDISNRVELSKNHKILVGDETLIKIVAEKIYQNYSSVGITSTNYLAFCDDNHCIKAIFVDKILDGWILAKETIRKMPNKAKMKKIINLAT